MEYLGIILMAITCFLAGYARGRLSGFDDGIQRGIEIGEK